MPNINKKYVFLYYLIYRLVILFKFINIQFMRNFLGVALFIAWLLLLVFYFKTSDCACKSKEISNTVGIETNTTVTKAKTSINDEKTDLKPTKKSGPILFNYGKKETILGESWKGYSSNLKAQLNDKNILRITGLYNKNEVNNTTFKNLGLARADEARKALKLAKNQVQMIGKLVESPFSKNELFEAIDFITLQKTKSIDETALDNKIRIRFPFNSTNKLSDREVENYLNKIAKRIKVSGEKVKLTGHTDNIGSDASNIKLGQRRADIIKKYLLKRGVNTNQILTSSKGESSPIATNKTNVGRSENRRTELEFLK